jgi:tRNA (cmo5U34)-methyltransferase
LYGSNKKHFDEEAQKFDRYPQLIPYYDEMLQALISAIPFDADSPIQVLDLGCGTGTLAKHILQAFPLAHVTCLDFSEQMIGMAQAKLADFSRVSYRVQDFREYAPAHPYHAIVSSLALHHLVTDDEKKAFYQKVFQSLLPGGCFYNADVVLAMSTCSRHTYNAGRHLCRQIAEDEIENAGCGNMLKKTARSTGQQLTWLSAIGYKSVDVLWKYYNFAVYGGLKPSDP